MERGAPPLRGRRVSLWCAESRIPAPCGVTLAPLRGYSAADLPALRGDGAAVYTKRQVIALLEHWDELGDGRFSVDADDRVDQALTLGPQGARVRRRVHPCGGFENVICSRSDLEAALADLVEERWTERGGERVCVGRDSFALRCVLGRLVAGYGLGDVARLFRCDRGMVNAAFWGGIGRMVEFLSAGGARPSAGQRAAARGAAGALGVAL